MMPSDFSVSPNQYLAFFAGPRPSGCGRLFFAGAGWSVFSCFQIIFFADFLRESGGKNEFSNFRYCPFGVLHPTVQALRKRDRLGIFGPETGPEIDSAL